MTSSLVGSEMCIRDSRSSVASIQGSRGVVDAVDGTTQNTPQATALTRAVSYTHLTLPTICSV
eukprot:2205395-Prorocentrum_lima.AAC.1